MKINWFTLIAQIINFLVLMWLLKRYLYKPILKAIDERENKIVAQLEDAEVKKAEAGKERDEFNKKNEVFDQEREALMQKAIAESNLEAQKLKENARKEANALKVKLEKGARKDQENRNREITERIQHEVLDMAKTTLAELSSVSLEEQTVLAFLKKINTLTVTEKEKFTATLKSGNGPILIQSAFKLSGKQQTAVRQAFTKLLGKESQFQFKTVAELINGIELSANGYKLSWSFSAYIKSLEKSIIESGKDSLKIKSE